MEEAKENIVKLVLPFPNFLWMLGAKPNTLPNEKALYEPRKEQKKTIKPMQMIKNYYEAGHYRPVFGNKSPDQDL